MTRFRFLKKPNWFKKKPQKPTKYNIYQDVIPDSKYRKPIPEMLMMYYRGIGGKMIPVKRISSEEIQLPNGERMICLVDPQPIDYRLTDRKSRMKEKISKVFLPYRFTCWRGYRLHHTYQGWRMTFNPYTMNVCSDEKRRAVLIEQKIAMPYHISPTRTIYILLSRKTGNPIWKKEKIPKEWFDEDEWKDFEETGEKIINCFPYTKLEEWLKQEDEDGKKKFDTDAIEIAELPIKTEYDVTQIEMLLAEAGEIAYGNVLKEYIKSQDAIGDEHPILWFYVIGIAGMLLTMVAFLFAANEGVFGKWSVMKEFLTMIRCFF